MLTWRVRFGAVLWRRACGVGASALFLLSARLPAQPPPRSTMPDTVRQYVSAAMTAFRTHSVHRTEVDWLSLEDSVVGRAANAQAPAGTWAALTWALRRVDPHSFLMPPEQMMTSAGVMVPPAAQPMTRRPVGQLLPGDIALLTVPPHSGRNRPAYVDSLQSQIGALDSAGACGWVLDLRENTGGNMWPMLAGVGPLLGAEVVGSMTNSPPDVGWHYRDGRSWSGGSTPPADPGGWGSAAPRRLSNANAPVALLVGRQTASSGEITLLAFLGRPNVRSFGDSTAGRNSANASVLLRDGATLLVTSAYPRDRLGRRYPLSVGPDELVSSEESAGGDAPLRHAVAWLRLQPPCIRRR